MWVFKIWVLAKNYYYSNRQSQNDSDAYNGENYIEKITGSHVAELQEAEVNSDVHVQIAFDPKTKNSSPKLSLSYFVLYAITYFKVVSQGVRDAIKGALDDKQKHVNKNRAQIHSKSRALNSHSYKADVFNFG